MNFLLKKGWGFIVWNWETKSRILYEWLDSGNINSSEQENWCLEACRLEVFERLGMAHTCCELEYRANNFCAFATVQMPEDEQFELQDEDRCAGLVQALQAYVRLYEALRMEYSEPTAVFWKAWWGTLTDLLPQRDDSPDSAAGKGQGLPRGEDIDAQTESNDQVPDDVSSDCGPNEKEIRSRMEVLLASRGLALMGDVFSEDFSEDKTRHTKMSFPRSQVWPR